MPKVSRESASQVRDFEMAEDRSEEFDGYSVRAAVERFRAARGRAAAATPP
jgi:hypothetical protein